MRRQRGGNNTRVAVDLAYKYALPFLRKFGTKALPFVLKKHGFQRGGVFRGKNRQRGRKRKQRGGWYAEFRRESDRVKSLRDLPKFYLGKLEKKLERLSK